MANFHYHNNRIPDYVSAIQKAIRWCEVNDARYFVRELINMDVPYSAWGQLRVVAAEDIGMAEPSMVGYVEKCLDQYETLRQEKYKIDHKNVKHIKMLCDIIDRVVIAEAISSKVRLLPMANQITLFNIYKNEKFNLSNYEYFTKFVQALNEDDIEKALYYAFVVDKIYGDTEQILIEIRNQSKKRNEVLVNEWIDAYEKKGNLLTLSGSIMLLCKDLKRPHGEYKNDIANHLSIPIKFTKIPNRAYDMHTIKGLKMGRGLNHFFNVSGTLKNKKFPNYLEERGKQAYFDAEKEGFENGEIPIQAIRDKTKQHIMTA